MADLKITKLIIDGNNYVIPDAATNQKGLMSADHFNKLENLPAGAEVNKIDSVKVNGSLLSILSKAVDILIKEGVSNGSISVNDEDVKVKGLKALAYKDQITENDLEEALKEEIEAGSQASQDLVEVKSALETLKGEGVGSIKKQITDALNTFATETTDNGVIDKFAEMVTWFAEHDGDSEQVGQLLADVQAIQAIVKGIGGTSEPATVLAAIQKAISDLDLDNTYVKKSTYTTEMAKKVDVEEGKGLSKNDFTDAYKKQLDELSTTIESAKVTYSYDEASMALTLNNISASAN